MHEDFMRQAIGLSRTHMLNGAGGPFGAVIVRDGKIIGEGWNQVTSSCDPTAHAEMVAIRAACRRIGDFSLKGAVIYTSCEPCPMCLGAIYWSRLDQVYYANTRADAAAIDFDDSFLYDQIALPLAAQSMPFARLCADEARAVFDAWAAKSDRVPY